MSHDIDQSQIQPQLNIMENGLQLALTALRSLGGDNTEDLIESLDTIEGLIRDAANKLDEFRNPEDYQPIAGRISK